MSPFEQFPSPEGKKTVSLTKEEYEKLATLSPEDPEFLAILSEKKIPLDGGEIEVEIVKEDGTREKITMTTSKGDFGTEVKGE